MFDKPSIQQSTLEDLARHCAEEAHSYFENKNSDSSYCLELFRRAIQNNDQRALEIIIVQFQPLVARWVNRSMERYPGLELESEETQDFVAQAFERFWISFTPAKFEKTRSMNDILKYLQLCVHGAILDTWRKMRHIQLEQEIQAEEQEFPKPEPENFLRLDEFWQIIKEKAKDPKEYTVAYASFSLDLLPPEIFAEYPGMFRDTKEVYQIRADFLSRLKNEDIMQEEKPVKVRRFDQRIDLPRQSLAVPIHQPPVDQTRIVLSIEGESGTSVHELTPDHLMITVGPYLKAISDIQQIMDEILEKSSRKIKINSITQHSPISVSLDGAGEAVEVIKNTVVPWRRKHIEQLAHLSLTEKEVEIEIKRAEVLERRARAEKDRQEAERLSAEATLKRAETERMKMENEKLHQELHSAKVKLALEIIDKMSSDLSEEQRIIFVTRLLGPLSLLTDSNIQITER